MHAFEERLCVESASPCALASCRVEVGAATVLVLGAPRSLRCLVLEDDRELLQDPQPLAGALLALGAQRVRAQSLLFACSRSEDEHWVSVYLLGLKEGVVAATLMHALRVEYRPLCVTLLRSQPSAYLAVSGADLALHMYALERGRLVRSPERDAVRASWEERLEMGKPHCRSPCLQLSLEEEEAYGAGSQGAAGFASGALVLDLSAHLDGSGGKLQEHRRRPDPPLCHHASLLYEASVSCVRWLHLQTAGLVRGRLAPYAAVGLCSGRVDVVPMGEGLRPVSVRCDLTHGAVQALAVAQEGCDDALFVGFGDGTVQGLVFYPYTSEFVRVFEVSFAFPLHCLFAHLTDSGRRLLVAVTAASVHLLEAAE